MALLIDGYNLLHVTDIFAEAGAGTELHRARLALLNYLAGAIDGRQRRETTIVFDAAGAPPGLPRTIMHEQMTVHFAHRHSDADEMIEELLEQHTAPRSLLVVSSDHRVQRAARHHGATFVDSERWYSDLVAAGRVAAEEDTAAKPSHDVPAAERDYWIRKFDGATAEDTDPSNPFPPGYADDIREGDL